MNWGRPNSLDDPAIAIWDAAQRGTRATADEFDATDIALIEAFLAQDAIPGPSAHFQDELSRRLAGIALVQPSNDQQRAVPHGSKRPPRRLAVMAPDRAGGMRAQRWVRLSAVAAVLALVAIAGLLVVYRAVPSPSEAPPIPAADVPKPTLETLARFEIESPMWGMPDATAWTHMDSGMMRIDPESTFTTDAGWYTSVDGPLALTVVQGALEITLSGPALLSTSEQQTPPNEIPAGTTISVHPRDTIVFSAHNPVAGNNPGNESAIVIYGIAGSFDYSDIDYTVRPTNVPVTNNDSSDTFQPLLSTGASVTLQRVELQPFDSFVFDPSPNWRFVSSSYPAHFEGLGMYSGAVETLSPNLPVRPIYLPLELRLLGRGAHTLVNSGDEPITLYFFVVEPHPNPADSTPIS